MSDAREPWAEPGIDCFRRAVRTLEAMSGRPADREEDTAIIEEALRAERASALEEAAKIADTMAAGALVAARIRALATTS
jgi:hypothetical protein